MFPDASHTSLGCRHPKQSQQLTDYRSFFFLTYLPASIPQSLDPHRDPCSAWSVSICEQTSYGGFLICSLVPASGYKQKRAVYDYKVGPNPLPQLGEFVITSPRLVQSQFQIAVRLMSYLLWSLQVLHSMKSCSIPHSRHWVVKFCLVLFSGFCLFLCVFHSYVEM